MFFSQNVNLVRTSKAKSSPILSNDRLEFSEKNRMLFNTGRTTKCYISAEWNKGTAWRLIINSKANSEIPLMTSTSD